MQPPPKKRCTPVENSKKEMHTRGKLHKRDAHPWKTPQKRCTPVENSK
jgi:hypothetical protein